MNGRDLTLGLVALSAAGAAGIAATRRARTGQRNVPADPLAEDLANALANALADATRRIGPQVHPVLAAGTYLQLRALANAVKTGSPGSLRHAAERMAPLVPGGTDLVPIPSSSGSTDANRVLADAIAARAAELGVACRVVDALTGDARASSLEKKRAGEPSLLARQVRTRASPGREALLGSAHPVLLVDNVIATGATARAAAHALDLPGRVGILALAVTADPGAAARKNWATTWKTPLASPWFARWFGDSQVVDAEGRPLVAWHGQPTGTPDFDAFDFDRAIDLGMHFGTREAARVVSETVRPYYLSIQRPLELDDPGDWVSGPSYAGTKPIRAHTGISTLDQLVANGTCTVREVQSVADRIHALRVKPAHHLSFQRYRVEASRLLRALIASFDYDGVVYENHGEHWGSRSWIAFHPEQVKSAWPPGLEPSSRANVGTFSPEDPRVSANREAPTVPAYPGPTLAPGASLDAVADAYLELRHAVPDPVLLRVLHEYAAADLDGAPRPDLGSFDKHQYFMSPEGMAKHLRAGDFPDMARLLRAMPGAWADAVTMATRIRARKKVAAAVEAKKQAADARWEGQGIVLDPWSMPPARQLCGKDAWLYHGTTSKFLPRILRDGLVPGDEPPRRKRLRRQDRKSNTGGPGDPVRYQPHVFLTANEAGHASSAEWYARGAAATHGGDPVILRVLVPWDDLEPDPDDADIASGRYQFVIDRVPPGAILEVDGKRRKPRSPP